MNAWTSDFAPSMGAALAYYTLFSIAPLLIIVIAVAGLVFGADAVRTVVFDQLQALMGQEGAEAVQDMLASSSDTKTGAIATLVSVAGLAIGATTVFNEIQNDLDRIWRAPALNESGGLWNLLRTRLLSFGMILGVAFLLAVSLVVSAALATLGKWWDTWLGHWETLAHFLDIGVSLALLTLIFGLIYKMIPRVQVSWHDVWIGAAVTALLFTIGKVLIGLYLGKSDVTSSFGTAGSLVIVMVWVYYASQIFLFGAELTRVYAETHGSRRDQTKDRRSTATKTGRRRTDSGMMGSPA
jgi:membrane protein